MIQHVEVEELCFLFYNKLKKENINIDNIFFHGADLSDFCCCMTYLTLSTLGVSAMIENKDTLTNENYYTYFTPALYNNKKLLKHLEENGTIKVGKKEKEESYEQ